ncbi:hypothetical protein [Echinimonas agarilytica]|uniref:Phytase-like domain-containing protein n=1 Tax=Echinimonas agarilytica TaxID=1215918 RepID=A0AA42B5W8_9GAMM|nr:hypothetical protein [Echinimonas agarilytica]MCM2678157.1 hypothetical protein [Echinimonas agarilytica]
MKKMILNKTPIAQSLAMVLLGSMLSACGVNEEKQEPPVFDDVQDYVPHAFTISDDLNVAKEDVATSFGLMQVRGIGFSGVEIGVRVENGEYAIATRSVPEDGVTRITCGEFTDQPGIVTSMQDVCVRIKPDDLPVEFEGTASATLFVGNEDLVDENGEPVAERVKSDEYTLSIEALDDVPTPLAFASLSLQAENELVCSSESDAGLVDSINVPISLEVEGGFYKLNGGEPATEPVMVSTGDFIQACVMTLTGQGVSSTATIKLQNAPDAEFTAKTHPGDQPPVLNVMWPPQYSSTNVDSLVARGEVFIDPELIETGATVESLTLNGEALELTLVSAEGEAPVYAWEKAITTTTAGLNAFSLVATSATDSGELSQTTELSVFKQAFDEQFPAARENFGTLADVAFDKAGNRLFLLDYQQDAIYSLNLEDGAHDQYSDLAADMSALGTDQGGPVTNPAAFGIVLDEANNSLIFTEKSKDRMYQFNLANDVLSVFSYKGTGAETWPGTLNKLREPGANNASEFRDPAQMAIRNRDGYLMTANAQHVANGASSNPGIPMVRLNDQDPAEDVDSEYLRGNHFQILQNDATNPVLLGWGVDVYNAASADDAMDGDVYWFGNDNSLLKIPFETAFSAIDETLVFSSEELPAFTTAIKENANRNDFVPRSLAVDESKQILLTTNTVSATEGQLIAIDLTTEQRSVLADNSDASQAPLLPLSSVYEHSELGYYIAVAFEDASWGGNMNVVYAIDKETLDRVVLTKPANP